MKLVEDRQYEEAAELLRSILEETPDHEQARHMLQRLEQILGIIEQNGTTGMP